MSEAVDDGALIWLEFRARLSSDKHVNKIFACHFIFAHSARVKEEKNQTKSHFNINS